MKWLGEQIRQRRLVDLRLTKPRKHGLSFLADARADGETVVIGGYAVESSQLLETKKAPWYCIQLDRENCSWAFAKQGQAYRCIAALELLATLVCLMVFCSRNETATETEIAMSAFTDNLGNEGLVVKNLTSKFPLYIILLELTEQLKHKNVHLDLIWIPREKNEAADDLTNFKFDRFNLENRVEVDLLTLPWIILPKLLPEAVELMREIQEKKERRNTGNSTAVREKKRKSEALRVTDPW